MIHEVRALPFQEPGKPLRPPPARLRPSSLPKMLPAKKLRELSCCWSSCIGKCQRSGILLVAATTATTSTTIITIIILLFPPRAPCQQASTSVVAVAGAQRNVRACPLRNNYY